ncbi:invasion protein expression up-regulator SirB [Moraxella sp. ZY210820]|uniref:invasion protein expression up-regulator SirB n=1 Tax=unclassified Moraxella TaxID=2685852 RepID=UPI00272EF998|nr:invasion protein expression up-regulator SirB [Moraxella sp. ZY210820]WLF83447.1 invasion protein expression up-regulator SirB [Moraxella sp. ZY210820]
MNFAHFTLAHYIHLIGFALLLVVVLIRAKTLFTGLTAIENENNETLTTANLQPDQKYRRLYVACQHSCLTLVGFSGIYLLYNKDFQIQPWFYAKIMLFAVLLSSLIKAFKKPNPHILLVQRKAGLYIALFCYISILALVIVNGN